MNKSKNIKKLYITKVEGKYINWVGEPEHSSTTVDTGIIKKWDNFEESIRVDEFGAYIEVKEPVNYNTTKVIENQIKTIKLIFDRDLTAKQEALLVKEIDKALQTAFEAGEKAREKEMREIALEKGIVKLAEELELLEKDYLIKKLIKDFKASLNPTKEGEE